MGGFANNAPIVTDGLVFYVDAGNSNSYPGSGTTWSDLIGSNDGALTNGPTFDSANGGSIVFDGTNDYVGSINLGITFSDITFSCWVKRIGTQGDYTGLMISDGANSNSGIGIMSSGRIWAMWIGNIWGHNSGLSISDQTWTMVTVVFNSGTVNFYKNDNSETPSIGTPATYSGTSAFPNLQIGKDRNFSNRILYGNIACTSIYNRALSSTEITQNYNALKNRFV
jgi:hypothetical protein